MALRSGLPALAAGFFLAGCLPIPQVVPERLAPRYLGMGPSEVEMNCARTNEFMFIHGPHGVFLRVSPKYFPDARRAVLEMRLVAIQGRPALLESQEIAVTPANGGPVRTLAIASGMREPGRTYDFDVHIEDLPPGPFRVGMPRLRIGDEVWRPAAVELAPASATLRPMPFNC